MARNIVSEHIGQCNLDAPEGGIFVKYYCTYGKGIINIYISTNNIHNVYEALNTLKHSPHRCHFFSKSNNILSHHCHSYIATAEEIAIREEIHAAEQQHK